MKNTMKISLVVTGAILLQSIAGGLAYADSPSGTVMYNGQAIQVTNGQFTLNGIAGTIDSNGNYSYNGTSANILNTPGVTGYQVTGQAPVAVTPVAPVAAPAPTGPTGTVTYNGQSIQVTNGQFNISGKTGTIDANGMVTYNGQTKNLKDIPGVTAYQVQGQAAVTVTPTSASAGGFNNANVAGATANGGSNGMPNGVLVTQGGQSVTSDQIHQFFANNPSDKDILTQASKWGMSMGDIGVALNNLGLLFNNGDWRSVQLNDPTNGSIFNRLSNEVYQGTMGYGIDSSTPNVATQVITPGYGHTSINDGNGSSHWQAYGPGSAPASMQAPIGNGYTYVAPPANYSITGGSTTNSTATANVNATILGSFGTSNPYGSSFSAGNLNTLDTWITNKIRAKANTMSATDYANFINTLATKVTTLKNSMTDQTKVAVLNYILYEVTTIQNGLSGSTTSFLDSLVQ